MSNKHKAEGNKQGNKHQTKLSGDINIHDNSGNEKNDYEGEYEVDEIYNDNDSATNDVNKI